MSYDSPDYTINREYFAGESTAGATTESLKFRVFQKAVLKKVHAVVTVAGTATTHKLDVMHGTTSIGVITLSTSTAGVSASSALLNRDVPSLEQVSVKTGADATGKAHVVYEYEVASDAVSS